MQWYFYPINRFNHDQFLHTQLDKVSRAFAVVVPSVEQPLRAYLSVAYLLCRVLDNIENCQRPPSWKKQRCTENEQMLALPYQAISILSVWDAEAFHEMTEHEKRLMGKSTGLPDERLQKVDYIPLVLLGAAEPWKQMALQNVLMVKSLETV